MAAPTIPSPHLLGDISLQNKIVLITGAGSGINLTFAKLAHQHGARRILIADLELTQEAQDFVSSDPSNIKFQKTDVTKWKELEALFPSSLQHFSDVPDIVIPGAGVFEPPWSNFWEDAETEEYKQVEINVSHVIKLTRLAVRALLGRGKKGVVCPIASQAGIVGVYASPLYCATKHAVVGFVRSMAPAERLEGIKVVTVCPGAADTNIWGSRREFYMIDKLPKEAMCSREQIAQAMFDAITKGKYGGGTIIEVAPSKNTRVVPPWNSAEAGGASEMTVMQYNNTADLPPIFQQARDSADSDRKNPFPPK